MTRALRLPLILSVALYALSLALPAFYCDGHGGGASRQPVPGYEALLLGWFAAIFGVLGAFQGDFAFLGTVTWIVNPMLLVAWVLVLMGRRRGAMIASFAAFVVSLGFLAVRTIPVPDNQTMEHILPSFGYAAWVLSVACAMVAAGAGQDAGRVPLRLFKM